MPVIRRAESRRTETPAAVMTTLASPTQGGAAHALWRVDMRAGRQGPMHSIDTEQVWTVLEGGATAEIGDQTVTIDRGDTLVIPADVPRRVTAHPVHGLAAIVVAPVGMRAYAPGVDVDPHCATPDGGKLIPAWVA
ncbi:MAG TPA: cupin domain-containing protein [Thermopolyspora sp.]